MVYNKKILLSKEYKGLVKTDMKLFCKNLPAAIEHLIKAYLAGVFG